MTNNELARRPVLAESRRRTGAVGTCDGRVDVRAGLEVDLTLRGRGQSPNESDKDGGTG
jgi:hypothetical protein